VRALEMAPRVSGGVAHAMAVGVLCRSSERLRSVPESPRIRSACARGTERRSSGQSGPARAGNPGPRTALVPHAMTQPDAAFVVAHFEVRDVSTIMATLDALAITSCDDRGAQRPGLRCRQHQPASRATVPGALATGQRARARQHASAEDGLFGCDRPGSMPGWNDTRRTFKTSSHGRHPERSGVMNARATTERSQMPDSVPPRMQRGD
jgi:hypothetical protein